MPPKIKITDEMIVETAARLTREKGFDKLNARAQKNWGVRCSLFSGHLNRWRN